MKTAGGWNRYALALAYGLRNKIHNHLQGGRVTTTSCRRHCTGETQTLQFQQTFQLKTAVAKQWVKSNQVVTMIKAQGELLTTITADLNPTFTLCRPPS
jgi:hypothetical protein